MNSLLPAILEAIILSSALSLDAFAASFAYGSKKIKIPFKSVQTINLICGAITGLSLFVGSVLRQYTPARTTALISFIILFILGIFKLLDSITKSIIRRYNSFSREIKLSLLNFKLILKLYADPEEADIDGSKSLSPTEAASLAIALSLDGITVGLAAAIGSINGLAVFMFSLVTNMAAILTGSLAGNTLSEKSRLDLSWLSGIILIILSITKII